ncbi:MAG: Thioredoxin [Spartobacteria bacterium]|nr:Thioredoxin [Spartobacteria bacterium]
MLRTGYSSSSVLQELAKRRFADTLDATKQEQLIHAGATAELLAAIKSGSYTVPPEELNRAKQEKETQASRRAAEAEKSRKFSTLYQAQVAGERAAQAVTQEVDSHLVYQLLKGDLVQWRNGSVTRFDDEALEKKKLFLFYFSAHWCQPCRSFTPGLVNFYNEIAPKHPEIELIFISRDKSPFGMETYMHDTNMPWPAIDYQKVGAKEGINRYAGAGIPDLVLVDAGGKVISDSYEGKKYLGPAKVLADVDKLLSAKPPGSIAAR